PVAGQPWCLTLQVTKKIVGLYECRGDADDPGLDDDCGRNDDSCHQEGNRDISFLQFLELVESLREPVHDVQRKVADRDGKDDAEDQLDDCGDEREPVPCKSVHDTYGDPGDPGLYHDSDGKEDGGD